MVTIHDVAAYILERYGEMTTMKLQKLGYYSQVWSLVWDEEPLFPERVEAWANGPVIRELYDLHRGRFKVSQWPHGSSDTLSPDQRETIDGVLEYYGPRTSQWLSDLTHLEDPWRDARKGLSPRDRGHHEITHAAMAEYYGSLPPSES